MCFSHPADPRIIYEILHIGGKGTSFHFLHYYTTCSFSTKATNAMHLLTYLAVRYKIHRKVIIKFPAKNINTLIILNPSLPPSLPPSLSLSLSLSLFCAHAVLSNHSGCLITPHSAASGRHHPASIQRYFCLFS